MKSIALLGSTGSIGESTLKVAKHLLDEVRVVALAAHSNSKRLAEQIKEFSPEVVALFNEKEAAKLKAMNPPCTVLSGEQGVIEVATLPSVSMVVVGIVGMAALAPTIAAIEGGKSIGLANKEILVSGGELVMRLAHKHQTRLIPIDSEHSALFQCLTGERLESVRRLILTASGGPFFKRSLGDFKSITLKEALAHPTWSMGRKITIDSSTLMNKGFEMIEAAALFSMPPEKIDVVIHPQSVVHSMIEYQDGSIKGQMGVPNMIVPIQYALTYPSRKPGMLPPFDFTQPHSFSFFPPDEQKFPALLFAKQAMTEKGSLPCYLNAANEVLVERFLKEEISWHAITDKLGTLLAQHKQHTIDSVDALLAVDAEARRESLC